MISRRAIVLAWSFMILAAAGADDLCANLRDSFCILGQVQNFDPDHSVQLRWIDISDQSRTLVDQVSIDDFGSYHLCIKRDGPQVYEVLFPFAQSVIIAVDGSEHAIILDAEGKKGGTFTLRGSRCAVSFRQLVEDARSAHSDSMIMHVLKASEESLAVLPASSLLWPRSSSLSELADIVRKYASAYHGHPSAPALQQRYTATTAISPGGKAPPIIAPTHRGSMLSLGEMDSKLILVDFWASWCESCLDEFSELKKLYAQYKPHGFEILGVSVDINSRRWQLAIGKYDLPWPQVSELKAFDSSIPMAYQVTSIPFNYLIDNEGYIVEVDIDLAHLEGILREDLTGILGRGSR